MESMVSTLSAFSSIERRARSSEARTAILLSVSI
jgi:hypothetical protein